jgi:hypothetical protein
LEAALQQLQQWRPRDLLQQRQQQECLQQLWKRRWLHLQHLLTTLQLQVTPKLQHLQLPVTQLPESLLPLKLQLQLLAQPLSETARLRWQHSQQPRLQRLRHQQQCLPLQSRLHLPNLQLPMVTVQLRSQPLQQSAQQQLQQLKMIHQLQSRPQPPLLLPEVETAQLQQQLALPQHLLPSTHQLPNHRLPSLPPLPPAQHPREKVEKPWQSPLRRWPLLPQLDFVCRRPPSLQQQQPVRIPLKNCQLRLLPGLQQLPLHALHQHANLLQRLLHQRRPLQLQQGTHLPGLPPLQHHCQLPWQQQHVFLLLQLRLH